MEVAVVVAVVDDRTHGVVVRRVDDARGAGVLAVLEVVRVAVREDRELEHHRGAVARTRDGEALVVLELMRVAVAAGALRGRVLGLLGGGADGDVAASALAAVRDAAAGGERRGGSGGEEGGEDGGKHHGGGRVVQCAGPEGSI